MALLEVKNVTIEYTVDHGKMVAVEDVSFTLEEGEAMGLVGESGCGKTTMAKALMQLLASNGAVTKGQILFDGVDLVSLSKEEMRQMRHERIAMVSQSAMNSLNPVKTVGHQIMEGILAHRKIPKKEAYARAVEVFAMVGLEEKRLKAFPHQLSGGMKQRAIIAMALSLQPKLIIADEPTTALDVVVQDNILEQIKQIAKDTNSALILITHDISVVAEICDSILVMYGGKVMERSDTDSFFVSPRHPYSLGLQNAFPTLQSMAEKLISIPGSPPDLTVTQTGCRFQQRCPFMTELCQTVEPPLEQVANGQFSACHYNDQHVRFIQEAKEESSWQRVQDRIVEDLRRELL